jgi:hypothetical protein
MAMRGKKGDKPSMKEVVVTAKRIQKPDSVSSGYGAGQQKFATKDIKMAVKSGTLKADTTSTRKMQNTIGGNSDKAQSVALSIAKAKKKKK